jgi:ribosome-associated protein
MTKKSLDTSVLTLNDIIIKGIQEVKGSQITVVDLTNVPDAFSDYFILCTGSSDTNVQAICKSIEDTTRELINEKPQHVEGYREANWILMDYFETVVHIFKEEERELYNLEELWADAQLSLIPDLNE